MSRPLSLRQKYEPWIRQLFAQRLSKREIQSKLNQLKPKHKSKLVDMDLLKQLLIKIDQLWYHSTLIKAITEVFGGLQLQLDVDDDGEVAAHRIAAYVEERQGQLWFHVNSKLFKALFREKTRKGGYHVGGNLCHNRFDCMIGILLHETIHLLLSVADKLGIRPDLDFHDDCFHTLIEHWFNQSHAEHGLIPGLVQDLPLEDIRQGVKHAIERHESVYWLNDTTKQTLVPIEPKSIHKDMVKCLWNGKSISVHLSTVRFSR